MRHAGAVACGHPVTAAAAAEILAEGGNAVDAVIAAAVAACVAEPVLASFGGGGFLLATLPDRGFRLLDFFAETPRTAAADADVYPIDANFGPASQRFHVGIGTAAVPGLPAGLDAAHRWGASLPLARLVDPGRIAAATGVVTNEFQGYIFDIVRPILEATPAASAIYSAAATAAGGRLRQPELARTLERFGREGAEPFYRGDVARRTAALCAEEGGHLTAGDLADYHAIERAPLEFSFRGRRVLTNPPPSAGGALIRYSLRLLEGLPGAGPAAVARALALTHGRRPDILAGVDSGPLLDADLVALQRFQVNRGTTHISVVDDRGGAAALTLSNGEGCGSLIPGTGIMLNNMLGEEDINPAGIGNWPAGQRLGSMMAPTILAHEDDLWALGSGGSNRIRSAIVQVLLHLTRPGAGAAEAVAAPRLHVEDNLLSFEPGFPADAFDALTAMELHEWASQNLFFGGVHVAGRCNKAYVAASDARRGGHGVVL